MERCANTEYLNAYLRQEDAAQRWEDRAEEYAQAEIKDPKSDFYPWSKENFNEALCELSEKTLYRLANVRDDAETLKAVFDEMIEGYWYEQAKDYFLESDPSDWDDV